MGTVYYRVEELALSYDDEIRTLFQARLYYSNLAPRVKKNPPPFIAAGMGNTAARRQADIEVWHYYSFDAM